MKYISRGIFTATYFAVLALLLQVDNGQAQNLSYSGSLQYSSGSYIFEDVTKSFSFTNGLSWSAETGSFSFNVPFIVQTSPWISYGGSGMLPTGGPQHQTVRDSSGRGSGGNGMGPGSRHNDKEAIPLPDTASYTKSSLGDPNIYANVNLWSSNTGNSSLRLNTGMKIPFADPDQGFGTGEWDFGVGFSASQRLNNFFLMATAMKWWFGDMADLELQNPLTYSLSIGRTLGDGNWLINTTFSGYTEVIDGYDPPIRLGIGIGHFFSQKISFNGTAFFGLTESTADVSFGLGWNVRL
jgi:hypothetical protein